MTDRPEVESSADAEPENLLPTRPYLDRYEIVREITDWDEWHEFGRLPAMSAECFYRPGTEGTVLRVDGDEHMQRRRALGSLLRRGGHQWFRDAALVPTAEAAIAEILEHPDPDGIARVDLQMWARKVNVQLAAAWMGLDYGCTPEGALVLGDLLEGTRHGGSMAMAGASFEDPAGDAYQEFVELFYDPAFARRRALWERVQRGELTEDELPRDVLMIMVKGEIEAWQDRDLAIREAIFLTPAAILTTSRGTVWALDELFQWFDRHPEDWPRRFDSDFLVRAANEALRLHPVVPAVPPRIATESVELCKGTAVARGEAAIGVMGPANLDEAVFGPDAAEFNPHREVPVGVLPYGTAFGVGPHMCYGIPFVMGSEGADGNLVYLLKLLFRAGVQLDPDHPAPRLYEQRGRLDRETLMATMPGYGVYPVRFAPETGEQPG